MVPELYVQEFFVIGEANPFGTEWVTLKNLYNGQPDEYDSGPMMPGSYNWWNFTVTVFGEIYFTDPANPTAAEIDVLQQQSRSAGNHVSMLKVEIEYPMGQGKIRRFRMDVGAGIDIFIPLTQSVKARILGPTPASSPPAGSLPQDFTGGVQLATTLVVTAKCCDHPVSRPISTYTQLVATSQGNDATVEVQEGAKMLQVLSTGSLSGANRVRQLFVRRDFLGNVIDSTPIGDPEPTFASSFQTFEVELSGVCTDIFVPGVGGTPIVSSVIQLLEF